MHTEIRPRRRPSAGPLLVVVVALLMSFARCGGPEPTASGEPDGGPAVDLGTYRTVRLTADLDELSPNRKKMIGLLIEACRAMDDAFWYQAYGDRSALLESIEDADVRRYAEINYGPWDRLADNEPFVPGVGPKPPGANFYPADVTRDEFERAAAESDDARRALTSLYTLVDRAADGGLEAIPYSRAYQAPVERAALKLRAAAKLAENDAFRRYLELRATALLSDDYLASDMAWMDMKDNVLDVVIGPIETYEDKLFGYKAAFEGYVLIKDTAWSERLSRYAAMLPALQRGLPVPEAYRRETPGTDSDLNAYDAVYYGGDCNAGSKTIAINLPNDERVQLAKGTRRLQLKNVMRAKFDEILVPIGDVLIDPAQRRHVTFEAFFANTMFHEVAHGLGVKNVVDGSGTVRKALRERASAVEEGKADVLGLYMVTSLHEQGELGEAALEDYFVTFLASIFRSVRFGAASAHGQANMVRFNFFSDAGAFTRDGASGTYRVDPSKMTEAMNALSSKLLTLQGDGDYDAVAAFMDEMGGVRPGLQADLDRLADAGIAVDIVFEQGPAVLGLD